MNEVNKGSGHPKKRGTHISLCELDGWGVWGVDEEDPTRAQVASLDGSLGTTSRSLQDVRRGEVYVSYLGRTSKKVVSHTRDDRRGETKRFGFP